MKKPTGSGKPESSSMQYRAYILRLWTADSKRSAEWQASLEDPQTGNRIGFANLEELFLYLMEQNGRANLKST